MSDPDPGDPGDPQDPPAVDPPEPFDPERAMNTIKRQREAEKELRARHLAEKTVLEERLKAFEDAQLSEQEKAQKRIQELEQNAQQLAAERRDTLLRLAVSEKAGDLGIVSPRLALAALDKSQIEWSESGEPTNIDTALAKLVEDEPALVATAPRPKPPAVNASDGNNNQPPPALNADELEAARNAGKTPEQWAALKQGSGSAGGLTLEDWKRARAANQ